MTSISKSIQTPFTPEQMFGVVNDVEAYPLFLDRCYAVDILAQEDHRLVARLHFKKGLLKYGFATENTLNRPHSMTMNLLDGPFKTFSGQWDFVPNAEGSLVSFLLNYEFTSPSLALYLGGLVDQLGQTMSERFLLRARELYGS